MIGDQTIVHPQAHDVRKLLHAVLTTASHFEAFCIDYFPTIQQQFSNGMDREAKINLLLTCASPEQILRKLRRAYPNATAPAVGEPDESAQHSALALRQQLLSQRLANLLTERDTLRKYHADTGQLDREIAAAQRDLRHGPQLNPGEILADRYQLDVLVGQGAIAQVWQARNLYPDDAIPATVAVKVLHGNLSKDRTCLSRFVRGSQQMKRLQHPHIARVYLEASRYQGFHFFVMELFPDGDLHAAVLRDKDGRQRDKWLRAAMQAGEALIYAHQAGCIHRDVKPHNILLDAEGNARLADFDLARDERVRLTHSNVGFGAADYAAPEALRNAAHVDQRADQFGLGRTVLFVYFGKDLPGESINAQKAFISRLPVTAAVKAVLETATAWEAHERFQTVQEFCNALCAASACLPSPADAGESQGKAAAPADSIGNTTAPLPERRELRDSGHLASACSTSPALKANEELLWPTRAKVLALRLLPSHGRALARSVLLLCFALGLSGPPASSNQRPKPPPPPPGERVESPPTPHHRAPPAGRPDPPMISVAGGSIQIGSRKDEVVRDNEQPAYTATVAPFFIDKTEVTVADYKACVAAKQCSAPGTFAGCNWRKQGADDHPINCVDWQQASQFCAWIERRLPTEEEWEYTARGAAGRRFVWGEHAENRELCWARSEGPCPVASHPDGATPEGVLGMLDNVKEYTADLYRRCYAGDCPAEPPYHTVRGGSYDMGLIDDFYCARRYRRADNDPSATIGFRCAQ